MNKMMLTPAAGTARPAATDLLAQLGAARQGQDGDASAAFAQLLQAKGSALLTAPAALRVPSPQAAAGSATAQAPSGLQAAAATPRPASGDAAHGTSGSRATGEAARPTASDQARRQEAAKAAGRRTSEATATARDKAGPTADGGQAAALEDQRSVLAQVLRHLRHDGSRDEAEVEASSEDAAADEEDPAAEAGTPGMPSPFQALAPELQKALPAPSAGEARDGSTPGSADAARMLADPLAGASGLRDGMAGEGEATARDAGSPELRAGVAPLAAPGVRAADAQAANGEGTGLALESAAQAGKGGEGLANDKPLQPASFAGLLQQAQAGAVNERGAGGVTAGTRYELQSPLHGTGFAPEMAARLSLAAAEGVQQAQLHLNPAEMGPVQVQIVLEGQQAQISFVAEQADTRAVLEKSLPELAGALREQGLTLSGGGVFSQQQQAQSGQPGQAGRDGSQAGGRWASSPLHAGADDPAVQARPTSAASRPRGVLDLFA